jgi:hypothetical protein
VKLDAVLDGARSGAAWVWEQLGEFVQLLRHSPVARARAQAAVALCIVACGRTSPSASAPDSSLPQTTKPAAPLFVASDGGAADVRDAYVDELYKRAAEGTEEDLMRLARRLGPLDLMETARTADERRIAVRAMAFTEGLAALPILADLAAGEDEAMALDAAESATSLAGRGRDQNDPEDAEEMRAGCTKLLAVAKGSGKKALRIQAVRTLRLLADRGCAKVDDIPKDFD